MLFLEALALICLIFTTMMVVAQIIMMRRTLYPTRRKLGRGCNKLTFS